MVAHDGFTLEDLVSYADKHNEANGENNRDGHDHNLSRQLRRRRPDGGPRHLALRDRQKRNILATLFLSQGVPMLCGGDEIGRTQQGNNNAYCQDNEISWFDWKLDERRLQLLEFTKRLIALRKSEVTLRRRTFLDGERLRPSGYKDITWIRPDGKEMQEDDWELGYARALAFDWAAMRSTILIQRLATSSSETHCSSWPTPAKTACCFDCRGFRIEWERPGKQLLDTYSPTGEPSQRVFAGGVTVTVPDRSLVVLRQLSSVQSGRALERQGPRNSTDQG